METKIYFVAISYPGEIVKPVIVEQFKDWADANTYASLMCRTKNRKYVVLEQAVEWDGEPQEK